MIKINGVNSPSTINEPSQKSYGTYYLADNPQLFEPQRSNNFEFIVTDLDNLRRAGTIGNESEAYFENAQEILRLSVQSSSVPHFTQQAISIQRGNNTVNYAGKPEFGDGNVVIKDYIGADTKAILMAWQNIQYNVSTEKMGHASDYKKLCYLVEYTPDYQKVRTWKLHGCFITGLSEDGYDNNSNGDRNITVNIKYDRAEIDYSDLV